MAAERTESFQQNEESIDIKAIFSKLFRYWYLFALTIFVAVAIAFLFNKYTNPVYEVSGTVFIETSQQNLDPNSIIGLGAAYSSQLDVSNEIGKQPHFHWHTVRLKDLILKYHIIWMKDL